jgi:hypothetical protein
VTNKKLKPSFNFFTVLISRRKKEEGRRKKEEGRRKKEEGRRKKEEEGRRKKEEEKTWGNHGGIAPTTQNSKFRYPR